MLVINLFAGPGAGKSTTAAGLFNLMKYRGHSTELVTEFAKDLTWSGSFGELDNQLYVLAEQDRRLNRLRGKVDFVVTDSPLLLSSVYSHGRYLEPWFQDAVYGAFNSYDNLNVILNRTKPYRTEGRSQTHEEAVRLDTKIRFLVACRGGADILMDGDMEAPGRIYNHLERKGYFSSGL